MEGGTAEKANGLRSFFESGRYRPWFAAALIGLFLLGAWMRFSLPQVPLTNRDSGGYISPALALLANGTYEPSHRNFPYAAFVGSLLKVSGSFSSITITQHLLGLAGGLVFWLTWMRLKIFLPGDWRITAWHAVLGLGLVWGLLLSAQPVFYEHSMRPEAIYPFVISLHLFGAVCFLERSLVRKSLPPAIWWGAFMTAVSLGLYVLKPIWGLAVVSGGLPFLIVFFCARGKWRGVPFVAGAVGAVAGTVLFLVPESVLSASRPHSVSLLNSQLFFVHANLIERELRRDLAKPGEPPFPREILLATADRFRDGFGETTRKRYRTLGFSPDFFMYGEANYQAQKYFQSRPGGTDRFYRHYYIRAWLGQPFQMLWKILRELSVFYRCDSKLTSAGTMLEFHKWYAESAAIHAAPEYLKPFRGWGPFRDYMAEVRRTTAADDPYRRDLMLVFLSVVDATYVVVLPLFLIAGFLWGRKPGTLPGVPLLWLGAWIFSYNFAITLTVALVHSMSIQRYADTQFCLTLFSFCSGVLLLAAILTTRFFPPRPADG